MGTSALRITAPFCSNRPSPKNAKKARKTGMCQSGTVKYILNTRRKKVNFFSHIERYVNDRQRLTHFQSTPHKGRHFFPAVAQAYAISIHTPIRGRQAVLFGQQSDGSRKPHRKGVLLPVLTQLQQSPQRFRCKRVQLFVQGFRLK